MKCKSAIVTHILPIKQIWEFVLGMVNAQGRGPVVCSQPGPQGVRGWSQAKQTVSLGGQLSSHQGLSSGFTTFTSHYFPL